MGALEESVISTVEVGQTETPLGHSNRKPWSPDIEPHSWFKAHSALVPWVPAVPCPIPEVALRTTVLEPCRSWAMDGRVKDNITGPVPG